MQAQSILHSAKLLRICILFLTIVSFQNSVFCADKVSLLPQWIPQAQFAGYMVALEKGFYRDAGIDLTLLRGGSQFSPLELLQQEKCTFATSWLSTAIQQRSAGAKVLNLAQIIQRSALMLIARKSSGIKVPGDLQGRKVALWGGDFRIQPVALFTRDHLNVQIIPLYETS